MAAIIPFVPTFSVKKRKESIEVHETTIKMINFAFYNAYMMCVTNHSLYVNNWK